MEEYVLISQAKPQVECRRRNAEGGWDTVIDQVGDRVMLPSINLEFAIAVLFRVLDGLSNVLQ